MATVVVTDGDERAALATVRSVGSAGHRVIVVAARDSSLAGHSRYSAAHRRLPEPLSEPHEFVVALERLCSEMDVDFVIPVTEPALLALADASQTKMGAFAPVPRPEDLRAILRKDLVLEAGRSAGFADPTQTILWDADAPVPSDLHFPCVVKPTRSVVGPPGLRSKTSVSYARDPAELRERLQNIPEAVWPVMLQHRINGQGMGLFFLMWEGRAVARFAHRRLREKPPSGGVSVLRESATVPERWFSQGEQLLQAFSWQGPAMVEIRVEEGSGEPFLMEINPRLWGSLQLAIDAGVDFPRLWVEAATGDPPAALPEYQCGVRTRWLLGDLDHLIARLRRSREDLNLPQHAPGRIATLRGFFREFRFRTRSELLRISDPLPGLVAVTRWARGR